MWTRTPDIGPRRIRHGIRICRSRRGRLHPDGIRADPPATLSRPCPRRSLARIHDRAMVPRSAFLPSIAVPGSRPGGGHGPAADACGARPVPDDRTVVCLLRVVIRHLGPELLRLAQGAHGLATFVAGLGPDFRRALAMDRPGAGADAGRSHN